MNQINNKIYNWKSSSLPSFKKIQDDKLQDQQEEYNVLLLGVTGSGKSLFINSAINYLKYNSLEEAIVKSPQDVNKLFEIPTKVSMCDSSYKIHSFNVGNDASDHCYDEIKIGESVTRAPKNYKVKYNDKTFNLIDTCGCGDTNGIENDSINFELILELISKLKYLHGICIFLKPNDSRSTIMYKWCLNELLTKLHHSAKENIMFCFPNSRGTFFRTGDSQITLRNYLQRLKLELGIEIENQHEREFYFDNDGLLFLATKKLGGYFDANEEAQYHYSWTKSSVSLKRLFTRIQSIPPHDVINTISINYSRKMISELSKPMSVCLKNINDNLNQIKLHKNKLRKSLNLINGNNGSGNSIEEKEILKELENNLYIPIIQVTSVPLSRPKSICLNSFCLEKENFKLSNSNSNSNNQSSISSPDENQYRYCCGNCFGGIFGNLYLCFNFDINGKCKSCFKANGSQCAHSDHLVIKTLETNCHQKEIPKFLNPSEIKQNTNELISQLKERKRLYEKEFKKISDASIQFSIFLSKNSLVQYNYDYEDFLNLQIKNPRQSADSIKLLTDHLENHRIQVENLKKVIQLDNNYKVKTAKEIMELVNEIKNLKFGHSIINKIQFTNNFNNTANSNGNIIHNISSAKKIISNLQNKV